MTARVWQAILGLVVCLSLFARPALSFLEVVFLEADAYAPGVVFVPSRRALAELAIWVSFVPFMSMDLRAPVDTRVFATDASSRTCTAVVSRVPEALVRELWRQRPRRGVRQRYAGEDDTAEDRIDDENDILLIFSALPERDFGLRSCAMQ